MFKKLVTIVCCWLFCLTVAHSAVLIFPLDESQPNAIGIIESLDIVPADQAEFDRIKAKAEQGDARSQFIIGWLYRKGEFVEQDYKKSFEWFSKAVAQGHIKAQAFLGNMYIRGQGTTKDYMLGTNLIKRAAHNGDPDGQFYLGILYIRGVGVPQSSFRALSWLDKAYKQNHIGAKGMLGFVLYRTANRTEDMARGTYMMKEACNDGDAFTCIRLRELFIRPMDLR